EYVSTSPCAVGSHARLSRVNSWVAESTAEEVAHCRGDVLCMRLQREMAGVEEAHDCAGNVSLECLGTRRQEEGIVLAANREKRGPVLSEVLLERGVQRDIALVVAEQIQLDLVGTAPGQVEVVERIAVGRNGRRIGDAVGVLPARRLGAEES